MAEQRRITPDEVIAAYRKTGLRPARESYCHRTGKTLCGCPIAAMYLANAKSPAKGADAIARRSEKWSYAHYGEDYTVPFTCGFDHPRNNCRYGTEVGALAHADGVAVAKAVAKAFPEST